LPEFFRQLQLPGAFGTGTFERQESLVAQIGLEQAAIVVSAARDDRLDRAEIVYKRPSSLPWRAYSSSFSSGDLRKELLSSDNVQLTLV
jgi:hypothetical protein